MSRASDRWRWSTAELLLAAGASAAIAHLEPLPENDPLSSSLKILPLTVAALRALERHAPRSSAESRFMGGVEGLALGILVLLTLGRQSFGLAATDWFLVGGYVLLLAHRTARLLLLWLPALGREPSRKRPLPLAFFFLPLVVYLTLQPWQAGERQVDGDEPFYLLLTHSLAYDFDAELANNYAREDWRAFMERPIEPQPGDPRGPAGEIYSRHNALLPLLLAPAYRAAGRWGAMAMMAMFSAALAFVTLRLALRGFARPPKPGAALLAYAIFAFSPPLLLYSYQIWIEVPAALVVALAFERIRLLSHQNLDHGARQREILLLIVLLAVLPLLKLRLGLVALALAALALDRIRPPRQAQLLLAGGLLLSIGALLVHNHLRYANPLKIHRWNELNLYSSSISDFARGAFGMFYDVAFGLFPSSPIWLLLLPAAVLLLRREAGLVRDLGIVTVPYLAALAPRFEWYGGWSPPFRYPLVFLPLFALALLPLLAERHRPGLRALLAGLGALTLVAALIYIVVPGFTYNFADGRTLLLDRLGARLDADLARFFPSTVRPRLATWIWPPASLLLLPLALGWRGRSGRFRQTAGMLGLAGALAWAAALPLWARHWPTRILEAEDAWVSKERGAAFPATWVLQRPRYRSGWLIPAQGRLEARLVPGGDTVRFRLAVRSNQRARLTVAAGAAELVELEVSSTDWQEIEAGPFTWPPGEPLVLRGGGLGRVAVDRVECLWE